jgi:hypothetical protein
MNVPHLSQQSQRADQTVEEVAEALFYQERLDRLEALELLLQIRADGGTHEAYGALSHEASMIVNDFIRDLRLDEFITSTLQQIRTRLNTGQPQQAHARQEFVDRERQCLVHILMLRCVVDAIDLTEAHAVALLGMLREMSEHYATIYPDGATIAAQFTMAMPAGPSASYGRLVPAASLPEAVLLHDIQVMFSTVLAVMYEPVVEMTPSASQYSGNGGNDGDSGGVMAGPGANASRAAPLARLLRSASFMTQFQQQLFQVDWKHAPIRALLRFAWRVALERLGSDASLRQMDRSADDIPAHVEHGCFDMLGAMFASVHFRRAAVRIQDCVLSLFDAMMCAFLSLMPDRVRELRSSQEEAVRAQQTYEQFRIGPRPEPSRMHFDRLLVALAVLYDKQPILAAKFWDHATFPDLHQFVRITGEGIMTGSFVPYLALLTALASGPDCATYAFSFLESPARRFVNWFHFFAALDNYQKEYQEAAELAGATTTTPAAAFGVSLSTASALAIRPEELYGLHSILRLLARVAQDSAIARLRLAEDPRLAALETLFRVLACPVPPTLKADLLIAIRMLAIEPSVSPKVWQYLEAIQLLPPTSAPPSSSSSAWPSSSTPALNTPASSSGFPSSTPSAVMSAAAGGIRFELAEIEARREEYPYVTAFVELLHQLLRHDSAALAAGVTPVLQEPSLAAYAMFVQRDVFERFDERNYKNVKERWRVARPALQFLLSLSVLAAKALPPAPNGSSLGPDVLGPSPHILKPQGVGGSHATGTPQTDGTGTGSGGGASGRVGPRQPLSPYESAGLDILFQLLQHSTLLRKILSIVSRGGGVSELEAERQDDGGEEREDCVLISMQLLLLILRFQDSVIQMHADLGEAHGPSSFFGTGRNAARHVVPLPLHELLLANRLDIVAIAEYVHYSQNQRISTLSVELVRHLSCREGMGSVVVRALAERGHQVPFVQAYVTLLETPETAAAPWLVDAMRAESDVAGNSDMAASDNNNNNNNNNALLPTTDDIAIMEEQRQLDVLLGIHASVRMAIVELLTEAASQPVPNMTQFLLGVTPAAAEANVGITSLGATMHTSDAFSGGDGIAAATSGGGSGLHRRTRGGRNNTASLGGGGSALALSYTTLEALTQVLQDPLLLETRPGLAWMCYKLIYTLIKEPSTRLRTTTLLRGLETDFFSQQLLHSPLTTPLLELSLQQQHIDVIDPSTARRIQLEHYLLARGWLFKSIALELHLTRSTGHRSYASRLLDLLYSIQLADVGATTHGGGGDGDVGGDVIGGHGGGGSSSSSWSNRKSDQGRYGPDGFGSGTTTAFGRGGGGVDMETMIPQQQQRMRMRELLDALEVYLSQPTPSFALTSHIFGRLDLNVVSATSRDSGLPIVNIQLLHRLLQQQQTLMDSDFASPSDRLQLQQEVSRILALAVSWNSFTQLLAAHAHAFDGWKQILLTTLTECYHLLGGNTQETVLYELLDILLSYLTEGYPPAASSSSTASGFSRMGGSQFQPAYQASASEALSLGLGQPIADCVLLLMGKLRAQVRVSVTSSYTTNLSEPEGTKGRTTDGSYSVGVGTSFLSTTTTTTAANHPFATAATHDGPSTEEHQAYLLPLDQLLSILSGIVKAILKSSDVFMRVSLYSALLNFLQYVVTLLTCKQALVAAQTQVFVVLTIIGFCAE